MHALPPLPPGRQTSHSRFLPLSEVTRIDTGKRESAAGGSSASTPSGVRRRSLTPTPVTELERRRSPTPVTELERLRSPEKLRSPILGSELEKNEHRLNRSLSVPRAFGTNISSESRRRSTPEYGEKRDKQDRMRTNSRGRSSSRPLSPLFVTNGRTASEGAPQGSAHRYEQECKRCLILPKFARTAQTALRGAELDLGELSLGDAQLGALLCDDTLVPVDRIKCWKLCGNRLTYTGATTLGTYVQHGTRVLNLARNELGLRGVDAIRGLTTGHRLTQLRSLNLSSNCLRNDAVAALCEALSECQLLLRLDLNCNDIREGTALGGLIAEHANLMRLAMHGNFLLAAGGASLFRGVLQNFENGGRIADIDVAWNGLGEGNAVDCAKALAAVLARPSGLFHLDLSYNGMDAQCCGAIAKAMRDNHQLYGLHMVGNAVMMDSNGFLTTLTAKPAWAAEANRGMMFGDPRSAPRQLLGARRSPQANGCTANLNSDDGILRDRDPLEQQTTCWACEGWEKVELRWSVKAGCELPRAVWAFTSLDNFRCGMRLRLEPVDTYFVGLMMAPPSQQLLVIFQVDNALRLQPDAQIVDLDSPISIDLCFCKELPKPNPPAIEMTQACKASVERSKVPIIESGLSGQRVVLIDGPDGPVQLPRITETEFRAQTAHMRQLSILVSFRRDTEKILHEAFELDYSLIKKGRLIPQFDEANVARVLEANYKKIVAIYRQLSAFGVAGASGFGVTSLDLGSFCAEVGLIDGQVTKLADVDRLFVASNSMSSEQRKDMLIRNDKELVRFQFLEFILRIADQRFRQTREVSSLAQAVERTFEQLQLVADLRLNEMDNFFSALHALEVDDVYRDHLPILEEAYRRFGGRAGPSGHSSFMSHSQFQELLERVGAYDRLFQPRQSGVAFRMGMMTQVDECYDSRFQEMNFLEFLHAIGAVVFLRDGFTADDFPELLEVFFSLFVERGVVPEALECHCTHARRSV